jgi:O-methyltransferase
MSLRQSARSTRRFLVHRFIVNYGRYMSYSKWIDRVNRRPLFHRFAEKNFNVPSFPTREAMWSFVASRRPMAIDYLEFGVHQGHSIFHFAGENKSSNSRFFGFDTFTGLPEDWNGDFRRGHFDMAGQPPRTGDARVEFVVGSFQETLPKFVANFRTGNPIIVHLDCDLYSSALYCLTKLDTFLPPGTILIFDEFGDVQHEFRAVHDYLSSYRGEVSVLCSHDDFFAIAVELQ